MRGTGGKKAQSRWKGSEPGRLWRGDAAGPDGKGADIIGHEVVVAGKIAGPETIRTLHDCEVVEDFPAVGCVGICLLYTSRCV